MPSGSRIWAGLALAMLGAQPAWAGPPYRTDDPVPLDLGHWEVYGFSTGSFAGAGAAGQLPATEINYGAAPNLQLHVMLPLAFDAPAGNGMRYGYGDSEFGFKYRFIDEDAHGWRPQVAIFPALEAPTGSAARGLGTGYAHGFLPVWMQKSLGKWTIDTGGGYWLNPGIGNKNYWFAGCVAERQVTEQLALGGEIFHQTADNNDDRDQTGFTLGAVYDLTDHYHLLFSAGRGLQDANSTNKLSYYAAFQFTF